LNNALESNILTINAGSSSLKTALYRVGRRATRLLLANVERIGSQVSRISIADTDNRRLVDQEEKLPNFSAALTAVLREIQNQISVAQLDGVGHRVVLGDSRCIQHQRIGKALLHTLQELTDLAPDHIPQVLESIAAVTRIYPDAPQVACSDSAFHNNMPQAARMLPLPRRFFQRGVMRYGFHGLSCEYVVQELTTLGPDAARGRVIVAHLGSGSSITAIHRGKSIDTSMGFTPLAGLIMGTRCGDLDPGVLLYLMNQEGTTARALSDLLNRESGLLGVSGYSADMRDLLERESKDPHCAEAIEMFCYQARKLIGAFTVALGGLDNLVFTGGIGENAAIIRERICTGLDVLGIRLSGADNHSHAPVISARGGAVTVRVIKTDEDLMIARHTRRVVTGDRSCEDDNGKDTRV
jgi:acetate kinase